MFRNTHWNWALEEEPGAHEKFKAIVEKAKGNHVRAAELMKISVVTFYRYLRKYDDLRKHYDSVREQIRSAEVRKYLGLDSR